MDSLLGLLDVPQSLNRYAYCLDNPFKYLDSSGSFVDLLLFAGIGVGIGQIAGFFYYVYEWRTNGGPFSLGRMLQYMLAGEAMGGVAGLYCYAWAHFVPLPPGTLGPILNGIKEPVLKATEPAAREIDETVNQIGTGVDSAIDRMKEEITKVLRPFIDWIAQGDEYRRLTFDEMLPIIEYQVIVQHGFDTYLKYSDNPYELHAVWHSNVCDYSHYEHGPNGMPFRTHTNCYEVI